MEVIEAIKSRRSVRAWTEEEVGDEMLAQILEAGRWSPSPLDSQPWHLVVVKKPETIQTLAQTAKEGGFMRSAKVCIVVSTEKQVMTEQEVQNQERKELIVWLAEHNQYEYAAAAALQDMWLAAWSLGIGACWVTMDRETTYLTLEIPREQVVIGSLALGHIRGSPVPHNEENRKPIGEMVFWEKYGVREKQS